jgi:serine/threonine protein phosphatase PrpC
MPFQCYGATRPQDGRSVNEDAFVIHHAPVPYAALADGAGNAERAAKRVLTLFGNLFSEAKSEDVSKPETWTKWVRLLDSALQGGTQSTFIAVTLVNGIAIGACAGDSRAYVVDREGTCIPVTEGANKARLGSGMTEAFHIRRAVSPGEILLLLTDGVWTPLGPYLIKKAVLGALGRHFSEVPGAILDAAGRTGRADDMTAIAVKLR